MIATMGGTAKGLQQLIQGRQYDNSRHEHGAHSKGQGIFQALFQFAQIGLGG